MTKIIKKQIPTPRGNSSEVTYNLKSGKPVVVILLEDPNFPEVLMEIYSDKQIKPIRFWEVRSLLGHINTKKHQLWFEILFDGRYCLKSFVNDHAEVEKRIKRMAEFFALFSPHIEKVANGSMDVFDVWTELQVLGLI
ncbi:MAG: hypothetical protein WCI84_10110 [Bacteroidota bacterium]